MTTTTDTVTLDWLDEFRPTVKQYHKTGYGNKELVREVKYPYAPMIYRYNNEAFKNFRLTWQRDVYGVIRFMCKLLAVAILFTSCKKDTCFDCRIITSSMGNAHVSDPVRKCGDKDDILRQAQQTQLNNPKMREVCTEVK